VVPDMIRRMTGLTVLSKLMLVVRTDVSCEGEEAGIEDREDNSEAGYHGCGARCAVS